MAISPIYVVCDDVPIIPGMWQWDSLHMQVADLQGGPLTGGPRGSWPQPPHINPALHATNECILALRAREKKNFIFILFIIQIANKCLIILMYDNYKSIRSEVNRSVNIELLIY